MSRSIIDWEEEISSRFRHVRLMNEIELNQIDFDEITNEIREILKQALNIKKVKKHKVQDHFESLGIQKSKDKNTS